MSENTLENIIFGLKAELKELKAENERLKKRHGVALLRNDDLDLENYELKKQITELKEKRENMQVVKDLLTSLMSAEQQLDPLKTGIRWSILKGWCKKYNIEVE